MTFALELRAGDGGGEARAWFAPGASSADWLRAAVAIGGDPLTAVVLPLPASRADRSPVGAVLVWPAEFAVAMDALAVAWHVRAGCVVVPGDATLWPPIDDDELRALVPFAWLVWHPTIGPIGFAEADVLRLVDLAQPTVVATRWDRARPGIAPVTRLRSVTLVQRITLADLFGGEAESIAVRRPDELPPLPGERRLRRPRFGWLRALIDRLVLALTRHVPRTASEPTWINRLEEWAMGTGRQVQSIDQQRRDQEIERLLRMLQDDPARGLAHALPLGGPAGRGVAPPTNRLGDRRLDFDAKALGGGRPVDQWEVNAPMQVRLRQLYHDLAASELAAGRARRAAYVFAHLLGDLRRAADALARGGFHREAALLYREKLNDPQAAVRCLVAGGLLGEAAQIEEERGELENAGDLRLILGQQDLATDLYERAHRRLLDGDRRIAAALLRAGKLGDADGALRELDSCWQAGGDALALAARLALLQRLEREGELLAALRTLAQRPDGPEQVRTATVLGRFAERGVSPACRDLLRDLVARAVAANFAVCGEDAWRRLTRAMRRTTPGDVVLPRDLARIARQQRVPVPAPHGHSGRPDLRRCWQCLGDFGPRPLVAQFGSGWAVVVRADVPRLVRIDASRASLDVFRQPLVGPGAIFRGMWSAHGELFVWLGSHDGRSRLSWVREERTAEARSTVLAPELLALAVAPDRAVAELEPAPERGGAVLAGTRADGESVNERFLADIGQGDDPPLLAAHVGCVLVADGKRLVLCNAEREVRIDLATRVTSLAAAPEIGQPFFLIGCEDGVLAWHTGQLEPVRLRSGPALHAPTVGWACCGIGVAVDEQHAWLLRSEPNGRDVGVAWSTDFRAGQPLRIVAAPDPAQVLFIAERTATCYSVR